MYQEYATRVFSPRDVRVALRFWVRCINQNHRVARDVNIDLGIMLLGAAHL
jgi:hypothetical protein